MSGRGWVRLESRSRLACVVAGLVAWLCAACGASSGQPAKALQHASMLWVGATASQSIAWLAEDGGYFRKNGVDVDLSFQSGSPTASASLAGGHVDFVQMAGPAVISSDAKGADE